MPCSCLTVTRLARPGTHPLDIHGHNRKSTYIIHIYGLYDNNMVCIVAQRSSFQRSRINGRKTSKMIIKNGNQGYVYVFR